YQLDKICLGKTRARRVADAAPRDELPVLLDGFGSRAVLHHLAVENPPEYTRLEELGNRVRLGDVADAVEGGEHRHLRRHGRTGNAAIGLREPARPCLDVALE